MALSPEDIDGIRQKLEAIEREQAELYDRLTGEFERQLDEIAALMLAQLMEHLRITLILGTKGEVLRDGRNLLSLTRFDDEFRKSAQRFGYRKAIVAFVGRFPQTFELLDKTFRVLSYALELPGLRKGRLLRASDLNLLHAQQTASIDVLGDASTDLGRKVKRKALNAVGGSTIADMQHMIHQAFNAGNSQAVSLGATAMATFWRVASDQVYGRIEASRETPLRYVFSGPNDRLTRPFCRHLLEESAHGKSWTKAQIAAMDNGQTGPGTVMFCGGGFNCRQNFILSLSDLAPAYEPVA